MAYCERIEGKFKLNRMGYVNRGMEIEEFEEGTCSWNLIEIMGKFLSLYWLLKILIKFLRGREVLNYS